MALSGWERKQYRVNGEYQRERDALIGRDGRQCRHCGSKKNLTIDHIIPVSRGGGEELSNKQLLCSHCNARKGANPDPRIAAM